MLFECALSQFARPKLVGLALLGVFCLSACATVPDKGPSEPIRIMPASMPPAAIDPMMTGFGSAKVGASLGDMIDMLGDAVPKTREQVAAIARAANSQPLGSARNPVRANSPNGQRAYIGRLRCPGGDAPTIVGRNNIGSGIYAMIVDRYTVSCVGLANQDIMIDMYHDWTENRAVPGFTIQEIQPQQ
jgi:hypothetical protein